MTTLRKFFRTPKGLVMLILAGLVVPSAFGEPTALVVRGLAAAIVPAALLDLVILGWRSGELAVPDGAIITGLIVAMILSPREPWYVIAATSAIAIVTKYLIRTKSANVFNPAALALVVTFFIFDTEQSWWGAVAEVSPWLLVVLIAAGVFITDRVNKVPLVLVFFGLYFALFTAAAFVGQPRHVAEIFVAPDLQGVLFFAFFILTDPPTSPVKYGDQIVCGAIVAIVSFTAFESFNVVYYLLAGVLAGNIFEAARRAWRQHQRTSASSLSSGRASHSS